MSLEVALAANTAVLEKVAGLLAEGNKIRADLLSSAANVTGKPAKKKAEAEATPAAATTTAPAVTEKAKDTPVVANDPKPGTSGTGSAVLDAVLKEFGGKITELNIRDEFGAYLGVTDEKEREIRRPNVAAILAEVGAKKATEIADQLDRAKAIFWVRKFKDGKTVDFKADLDDVPGAGKAAEPVDDLL